LAQITMVRSILIVLEPAERGKRDPPHDGDELYREPGRVVGEVDDPEPVFAEADAADERRDRRVDQAHHDLALVVHTEAQHSA
jgi:hypothetical protein